MSDSGTSIAAIRLTLAALATGPLGLVFAQPPAVQPGEVVPRDVRQIYDRGLQFLAASQSQDGTWDEGEPGPAMTQGLENAARADGSWAFGGKQGAGVTALALLAFLDSGEDANFGIYSGHIRKALRSLIGAQDANTGYFGPSMYHHGFAMLALAEAYGAVDDRTLWPDEKAPRSVGQALPQTADTRARGTFRGIHPLLRGAGPLPGGTSTPGRSGTRSSSASSGRRSSPTAASGAGSTVRGVIEVLGFGWVTTVAFVAHSASMGSPRIQARPTPDAKATSVELAFARQLAHLIARLQ